MTDAGAEAESDAGPDSGSDAGPDDGRAVEASEETAEQSCDLDDAAGRPCPLCETPMRRRHCKYVCPKHGVVYDCSDTFY